MSQNESPLSLLQECVVAGRGSATAAAATDVNMTLRCQQQVNDESSPIDIFMGVLRTKAASLQPYFASNASVNSTTGGAPHSALIQDFNASVRVWGAPSRS